MTDPFADLPKHHFGAILADPPWHFQTWAGASWNGEYRKDGSKIISPARAAQYDTMKESDLNLLHVEDLAAPDCVLFLWACWPILKWSLRTVEAWGFEYKTCGFCWVKANAQQIDMFRDEIADPYMALGYWTRSNSEFCLLATRGKPKRQDGGVRQAIIAPRREHSRKPDGIHERIERLVAGPYLELFARQSRPGWTTWGNEATKFDKPYDAQDDFAKSLDHGYEHIRKRVANGGPRGFMDDGTAE